MIAVLSPSKTLNENPPAIPREYSIPEFLDNASELVEILRTKSPDQLSQLMNISPKLTELNLRRYLEWKLPFTTSSAQRSILMFKGEVYSGLKAENLEESDLLFAQDHLRILSGLYGILRPLDLIRPYRLEMGTPLANGFGENLYEFWGNRLSQKINTELEKQDEPVLVNLASDEYFQALNPKNINARIIKCQFKEERGGKLTFITSFGKKARGLMLRYILKNRIDSPDDLKGFDYEGYYFNPEHSIGDTWLFSR